MNTLRMQSLIVGIAFLLSLLSAGSAADVDESKFPLWEIVGGEIPQLVVGTNFFKNVRVVRVSEFDLVIRFDGGLTKIPLPDLPEPLRSKYYNEEKFEAERRWETARKKEEALQPAGTIPRVAIAELLAHPWYFRGKKVEVVGYYVHGGRGIKSWIYQNKEDIFHRNGLSIDRFSLSDRRPILEAQRRELPELFDPFPVRMVGIFDELNVARAQLANVVILQDMK